MTEEKEFNYQIDKIIELDKNVAVISSTIEIMKSDISKINEKLEHIKENTDYVINTISPLTFNHSKEIKNLNENVAKINKRNLLLDENKKNKHWIMGFLFKERGNLPLIALFITALFAIHEWVLVYFNIK